MPDPARCKNCFYIIDGLTEPRCPECGREFDPNDRRTYTTKPMFIWWRYWLPAFALAVGVGIVLYAVLITWFGYGWAAAIVLPFSMGALIGYSCRVRIAGIVILCIVSVAVLAGGLMTLSFTGALCSLVLAGVALGPAVLGGLTGVALRRQLKRRATFDQGAYLPILFFLLLPAFWGVAEGRHQYPVETVQTSVIIPAPIGRAWEGVTFYEEVQHKPPLLLRLLLPRPLYTRGSTAHVGDLKSCVYSKGRLVKRITRRDEPRLLAFDVVRQRDIETHSVRLTGGSFTFEEVTPDQTRVTLATEYEPLLGPRFAWRWAERWGVHTLHEHVLHGMTMKAMDCAPAPGMRELARSEVIR